MAEVTTPEELLKITNVATFTSGVTDEEKEATQDVVFGIYEEVTTDTISTEEESTQENFGFTGFSVGDEDGGSTGFNNLNFSQKSGFVTGANPLDPKIIDIHHNGFSNVSVNNIRLNAQNADTLYIEVDKGLTAEARINEAKQKFVSINNKYTKFSSLEDVYLAEPLEENELLMQQNGKLRNIDLREITDVAPPVLYGGEF